MGRLVLINIVAITLKVLSRPATVEACMDHDGPELDFGNSALAFHCLIEKEICLKQISLEIICTDHVMTCLWESGSLTCNTLPGITYRLSRQMLTVSTNRSLGDVQSLECRLQANGRFNQLCMMNQIQKMSKVKPETVVNHRDEQNVTVVCQHSCPDCKAENGGSVVACLVISLILHILTIISVACGSLFWFKYRYRRVIIMTDAEQKDKQPLNGDNLYIIIPKSSKQSPPLSPGNSDDADSGTGDV